MLSIVYTIEFCHFWETMPEVIDLKKKRFNFAHNIREFSSYQQGPCLEHHDGRVQGCKTAQLVVTRK